MPICYGNSGGVGRFIKRVEQPLYIDHRTDESKAEAARGMQILGTAMVTLSATVSAIRRA